MLVGVFALVAVGGLFWLAYRRPRPRRWLIPRRQPVTVADRGVGSRSSDTARLLAELSQPLGPDADEQLGRRAEIAATLRQLGRADALPAVLACADASAGSPGGTLLAAEAVGYKNFRSTLTVASSDKRPALRALARVARGVRDGALDPAQLLRAGLLDSLAAVAPRDADPWVVAAGIEAERAARRAEQWLRAVPADIRATAGHHRDRLAASSDRRRRGLRDAPGRLIAGYAAAPADEQAATLRVLDDLRADVSVLFPTLPDRRAAWWADAVRCLRWSRARDYGPALAEQAERLLSVARPGPAAATVLSALRGSRGPAVERVLLRGAAHPDATARRAALAALGWTDPFDRGAVIAALQTARADADSGTRRAAVAALARFGELAALREFAVGLLAEDPAARHATILWAAEEEISWLWPDLDLVAAHADPDTALAATEALERMREAALGLTG